MGRSPFHAACLLLLWAVGACALAAWVATAAVAPAGYAAAALLLASTGVLAWREWTSTPTGSLRWRQGQWFWHPAGTVGGEEQPVAGLLVVLDLQSVLLLRSTATGRRGGWWLWLARRDDPVRWNSLRRAVFARVGADFADPTLGLGRMRDT